MPGIVARIGGVPPDDREIDAVLGALHHFAFYAKRVKQSHHGWVGWVGLGGPGLARGRCRRHLVVYRGDGLSQSDVGRSEDRATEIATRIGTQPAQLAIALGGSFAVGCLDLESGEFHCMSDLHGHHRVYYRQAGTTLYVACELKAFSGWPEISLEPDYEALRDLVNYAYPLGDRTSLAGVKLLPPASRLIFRDGVAQVERYWHPLYRPTEADDDSLCEEGFSIFAAAFAAKTAESRRFVVPVSGGLDSRLLLAQAQTTGKDLVTFTYGHANSREAKVARDVMRCMGVEPRWVRTDEFPYAADILRRSAWFGEGMMSLTASLVARVAEQLSDEPRTSLFLNGIYGGPTNFSNSYHKPDELVADMPRNEKVARIGRTMFSHQLHGTQNYRKLRPDFARLCDEAYDREIERLLPEHEAVSPFFGHQKDAFFIANRLCRFMNQVDLNRYYWHETIPLTSAGLYAFYLRLPDRLKFGRLLHKRILARFYPRAAEAQVFSTGLSVHDELAGRSPRRPDPRAQRWRHYVGRLTAGRCNLPDPEDYGAHDYVYRRNHDVRRFYEDVLGDERPLSGDCFDFAVVREYLHKARRGANIVSSLSLILAWELWLRQLRERRWDV